MKEREYRTAAFARFDTDGPNNDPETYVPWTPTKPHQPMFRHKYHDTKTARMDTKKFPSRVSKA
jgi:hypothetical protein